MQRIGWIVLQHAMKLVQEKEVLCLPDSSWSLFKSVRVKFVLEPLGSSMKLSKQTSLMFFLHARFSFSIGQRLPPKKAPCTFTDPDEKREREKKSGGV